QRLLGGARGLINGDSDPGGAPGPARGRRPRSAYPGRVDPRQPSKRLKAVSETGKGNMSMTQELNTAAPSARADRTARLRTWGLALLAALLAVAGRPGRSDATITFTPSGFIEEVVASGLPFATGIAFAPDGRMFIALKGGVVRVYQNGTLLPTPFIDITSQVANSNDRGLLGIAVHPDFPNTPYVYLLFTWNPPGFVNIASGARVA